MATGKGQRLQISLEPGEKAALERAAAVAHLSSSTFVVQAAVCRAEEVLVERKSIRLAPQVAAAFTGALEGSENINERLAEALRRSRRLVWLDWKMFRPASRVFSDRTMSRVSGFGAAA